MTSELKAALASTLDRHRRADRDCLPSTVVNTRMLGIILAAIGNSTPPKPEVADLVERAREVAAIAWLKETERAASETLAKCEREISAFDAMDPALGVFAENWRKHRAATERKLEIWRSLLDVVRDLATAMPKMHAMAAENERLRAESEARKVALEPMMDGISRSEWHLIKGERFKRILVAETAIARIRTALGGSDEK
jgi:hypothetical protein